MQRLQRNDNTCKRPEERCGKRKRKRKEQEVEMEEKQEEEKGSEEIKKEERQRDVVESWNKSLREENKEKEGLWERKGGKMRGRGKGCLRNEYGDVGSVLFFWGRDPRWNEKEE